MKLRSAALLALPFVALACGGSDPLSGDGGAEDGSALDGGSGEDGGASDGGSSSDASSSDASSSDAGPSDASAGDAGSGDAGSNDSGTIGDGGSSSDGGTADGGTADGGGSIDAGKDGGALLGPPCTRGPGFVAWKFHYNGSTSAITDVYSLPDSSNWTAVPAYSTSFVDAIHGGGIQIGGGNWILIRFSVAGLTQIKSATLSVYGRSYNTTTSGSFEAWSPLYGSIYSGTNSI